MLRSVMIWFVPKIKFQARDITQWHEHLPGRCKVLGSLPGTKIQNKQTKKPTKIKFLEPTRMDRPPTGNSSTNIPITIVMISIKQQRIKCKKPWCRYYRLLVREEELNQVKKIMLNTQKVTRQARSISYNRSFKTFNRQILLMMNYQ